LLKLKSKSSVNVSEQLSCDEVTIISLCGQDEVVTSRSKTVVVTAVVFKELLQDVMLVVHDSLEQTFFGVLSELG